MTQQKKPQNAAQLIGHVLAHVQDSIDVVADAGFRMIRTIGSAPEKKQEKEAGKPYVQKAKRLGKGALRFLGTVGDAYYRKYEELKKKEAEEG